MSSSICFSMDQSKTLSSGNGLKRSLYLQCTDESDIMQDNKCPEGDRRNEAKKACYALYDEKFRASGCFNFVRPKIFFDACVTAHCLTITPEGKEKVLCNYLETLSSNCECHTIDIAWRTDTLCRMFFFFPKIRLLQVFYFHFTVNTFPTIWTGTDWEHLKMTHQTWLR